MARRKSKWQQFADNFNSVYGTFSDVAEGWETNDIMEEKPELITAQDGSKHWTYGGKRYDKEITPDELRGLQYDRMGDVMAKYGNAKDAMDMRLRAEDLREKRAQNKLFHDTYQTKIDTLEAELEGLRGTNKGQDIKNEFDAANNPTVLEQNQADLDKTRADTEHVESQTADIDAMRPGRVKEQELINAGHGLSNDSKALDNKEKSQTSASRVEATNANNRANMSADELRLNTNEQILSLNKRIQSGEIEGFDNIKKEALKVAHSTGDPDLIKRLKDMNATDLAEALHTGQKLRADTAAALATGNPDKIVELIDGQDGIKGNIKLQTSEGGFFRLIQLDEEGYVDESKPVIEGKDWSTFGVNVMKALDPVESLNISLTQSSIANKDADTGLKKAQAGDYENKSNIAASKDKKDRRAKFFSSDRYQAAIDAKMSEDEIQREYEKWVEEHSSTGGLGGNYKGFSYEGMEE